MEIIIEVLPKKLKQHQHMFLAIPIFDILHKIIEIRILKRFLYFYIHYSIIHYRQEVETPKHPLRDEQIKKMQLMYYKIFVSLKKKKILLYVTTQMSQEDIMLSLISQRQKLEIPHGSIYRRHRKYQTLRSRKWNSGRQGLKRGGNEELLCNWFRVSVMQN